VELCKGYLTIFRKGRPDKRYFVLFKERLEYWSAQADYDRGDARRGCIANDDIVKLENTGMGFMLSLDGEGRNLDMRCEKEADIDVWSQQWRVALPSSVYAISAPVPTSSAMGAATVQFKADVKEETPASSTVAGMPKGQQRKRLKFEGWKVVDAGATLLKVSVGSALGLGGGQKNASALCLWHSRKIKDSGADERGGNQYGWCGLE